MFQHIRAPGTSSRETGKGKVVQNAGTPVPIPAGWLRVRIATWQALLRAGRPLIGRPPASSTSSQAQTKGAPQYM